MTLNRVYYTEARE